MKKSIIFGLLIIGAIFICFYRNHPMVTTVTIHDIVFTVDVAITPKEKEVGLGFRNSLAQNHGMLFVYTNKERYPFWMRNMRFPIDILWIDGRTIIDITKNVPVSDKPFNLLPLYHPKMPVDFVLEVNAGLSDQYGISVGDKIVIKN